MIFELATQQRGEGGMRGTRLSRLSTFVTSSSAAFALVVGLAACGSSPWPSSPRATSATTATPAPAASGPGVGKPAVTIGDKNFAEENILGALYAQALQAKGYTVTLKDNVGSSEIIH